MGPTGNAIKATLNAHTEKSFKAISLVMWIPIMMTFFTIVEGWKYLPHDLKGWKDMIKRPRRSTARLAVCYSSLSQPQAY